jgi:hypothetical protein
MEFFLMERGYDPNRPRDDNMNWEEYVRYYGEDESGDSVNIDTSGCEIVARVMLDRRTGKVSLESPDSSENP